MLRGGLIERHANADARKSQEALCDQELDGLWRARGLKHYTATLFAVDKKTPVPFGAGNVYSPGGSKRKQDYCFHKS